VLTKIVRVKTYDTFEDYLREEGLESSLPSINDIETGLSVYFKYFTKEDESQYGVIAIQIEKII
jgi:ASC-1-like (ASCH) protein